MKLTGNFKGAVGGMKPDFSWGGGEGGGGGGRAWPGATDIVF